MLGRLIAGARKFQPSIPGIPKKKEKKHQPPRRNKEKKPLNREGGGVCLRKKREKNGRFMEERIPTIPEKRRYLLSSIAIDSRYVRSGLSPLNPKGGVIQG